jgi:hypothetical protein
MESRFGRDFSGVRIFNDGAAASSARSVAANAYTVGNKIVFNQGRYAPESPGGKRLLAHELAHVVQQDGHAGPMMQREEQDEVAAESDQEKKNSSVMAQAIRAADSKHWEDAARLANGLSPADLKSFMFLYQKTPEFIKQLHIGALGAAGVGDKSAVALATETTYKEVRRKEEIRYKKQLAKDNGTAPPNEDGSSAETATRPKPLTVAEKKKQCEAGETAGLPVFPLRLPHGMWRLSAAPITAHRDGSDVVVKQPLNDVLGDKMFRKETKTLPLSVFTGGMRIAPDQIVRVRLYDFDDRIICATGEQMMKLSDASDTAVALGVIGTILDAASLAAPGVGTALVEKGMSKAASSVLIGVTDIALREGVEVYRQNAEVGYGLRDKIDWGQIVFETLFQAVTMSFGSMLTEAAVNSVGRQAIASPYTRSALKLAVGSVIQGGIALVRAEAQILFDHLRGKKQEMTVEGFLGELALAFAQGALMHAVMTAAGHHEEEIPGASHPEGTPAGGASGGKRPVAAEPENLGGAKPGGGGEHEGPHPAAKARPAKVDGKGMEPETGNSPKAMREEDAIAKRDVDDPGGTEKHKVIATKEGLGRCSPPPCPAIPMVYKKELAESEQLAAWYKKIRERGVTDPDGATEEAADLVRSLEMSRRNRANQAKREAAPTNPDRETDREVDAAFDKAAGDGTLVPRVEGGRIDDHKVPTKVKSRLDIDALDSGVADQGDKPIPLRPGETGKAAEARIKTVIGKKIGGFPGLKTLWEAAAKRALGGEELTKSNYPTKYKAARRIFWTLVNGKGPEAEAARAIFKDAGFEMKGGTNAPMLEGADVTLRDAESRISLDHKEEKAIGEGWRKALDADNLQLEFEMANKERENYQQRHPELRPGAAAPVSPPVSGGTP